MKKALFATIAVWSLTATQIATAVTVPPQEVEGEFLPQVKELAELQVQSTELVAEAQAQLDAYIKAKEEWSASFATTKRLTEKHVTFGARLVLNEQQLLSNTRQAFNGNQNAYNMSLLSPSAITAYELNQFLYGTGMQGLGEAFVKAELETGVNAIFLTSLAIHESAWGKSRIAQDKNNMFGYGAYDWSPYESAVYFNTKTEGIIFVAKKLKENYLLSSGKYYHGTSLPSVNTRYSTDSKWSSKIANTMNQIEKETLLMQNTNYEVNE